MHVKVALSVVGVDGPDTYYGCKSLKETSLNKRLHTIGHHAFYKCESLDTLTLPSTVTSIGNEAFCGCTRLKKVVLNKGLQTIGFGAFRDCRSLKEAVLNEGLQTIDMEAFEGCSSLESFCFAGISMRYGAIRDHITVKHQTEIETKVNAIRGAAMREGKISISLLAIDNWSTSRGPLHEILRLISYHELRQAATIADLALWKAKIGEAVGNDDYDRESCRVEFPGPVRDAVMQFLSY